MGAEVGNDGGGLVDGEGEELGLVAGEKVVVGGKGKNGEVAIWPIHL